MCDGALEIQQKQSGANWTVSQLQLDRCVLPATLFPSRVAFWRRGPPRPQRRSRGPRLLYGRAGRACARAKRHLGGAVGRGESRGSARGGGAAASGPARFRTRRSGTRRWENASFLGEEIGERVAPGRARRCRRCGGWGRRGMAWARSESVRVSPSQSESVRVRTGSARHGVGTVENTDRAGRW